MEDNIIAEVHKNKSEKVVIARRRYCGHDLLDCRVHFHTGAEWVPTRKGLALSPEQWNEVLPHLRRVLELSRSGL